MCLNSLPKLSIHAWISLEIWDTDCKFQFKYNLERRTDEAGAGGGGEVTTADTAEHIFRRLKLRISGSRLPRSRLTWKKLLHFVLGSTFFYPYLISIIICSAQMDERIRKTAYKTIINLEKQPINICIMSQYKNKAITIKKKLRKSIKHEEYKFFGFYTVLYICKTSPA